MASYSSYTLEQVVAMLEVKYESVVYWTYLEAVTAINEALLMWNSMTGFWKTSVDIPATATNWDYALPASIVFGTRVEYNGRPLAQASLGDMDYGLPGWQGQTTASGGQVPTSPKMWLPLSVDMIAIWPAPATATGTFTVDGISATPQLVNPSDYIDIGNEELNAILGYALHALALKEGGARFQSSMEYFKEFLIAAAEENDQLNESSEFRHFIGTDINRQTRITRGSPTAYDSMGGRQG